MKRILFLTILLLISFPVYGVSATYYIDYVAGANVNNGTSTGTPWKTHPYMPTAAACTGTGSAPTYVHNAGDEFIFKGEVTWPADCMGLTITSENGGSSDSVRNIYGSGNKSWYAGTSWNRPIFNGGGLGSTVLGSFILVWGASYITIKDIEFTGHNVNAAVVASHSEGVEVADIYIMNNSTYITMDNNKHHAWTHDSYANGARSVYEIILGPGTTCTGCKLENFTCDGSDSTGGGDSGTCVHNFWGGEISNSTMRYAASFVTGFGSLHDSDIGNIVYKFDEGMHQDTVFSTGAANVYNNKIHDISTGESLFFSLYAANVSYIYNNLIYNITGANTPVIGAQHSPSCQDASTAETYIYNNTWIVAGTQALRLCTACPNGGTYVLTNNHYINSDGVTDPVTVTPGNCTSVTENGTYKLLQSTATATTQGYTAGNLYQPTVGGSTINSGTTIGYFSTDLLSVSRPQGPAWDIGAYEYNAGGYGAAVQLGIGANTATITTGGNTMTINP